MQQNGVDINGVPLLRKPIFDIKIKAQRKNPFSRMEQNETAKELYRLAFFNPDKAQEAMIAIDMMDFEGIEEIREKIMQGNTLQNVCQQLMQENQMLKAVLSLPAAGMPQPGANAPTAAPMQGNTVNGAKSSPPSGGLASGIMDTRKPQPGYTQKLAKNSKANIENPSNKAMPGVR